MQEKIIFCIEKKENSLLVQEKIIFCIEKNLQKYFPPGRFEPPDFHSEGERPIHYSMEAGLQNSAECADYKLLSL